MSEDILERAKATAEKLDLPWEYDKYDQEIVTHTLQTEYGECGGEAYQYHEPAVDYGDPKRIEAIIEAMNLMPGLIAEVERLRSLNESLMENGNDLRTRCQKAEARTKELEADRIAYRNLGSRIEDLETYIERLEAAFLRSNAAMRYYQEGNRGPWPQVGEQFKEPYIQKAREALEKIKQEAGN